MNATYNRYLKGVLRRFAKIGIVIEPSLLVREALQQATTEINIDPKYKFCELTENDLSGIHKLRPSMSLERYRGFLRSGILCFGLKDGGHLAAKMWIDLKKINAVTYSRPLSDQEAYLFDAFSDEACRGQNLAPYLRLQCYAEAQVRGHSEIYSITDFTNTPARKFKAKLGASNEALIIYWKLFGFASHTWIAWHYTGPGMQDN